MSVNQSSDVSCDYNRWTSPEVFQLIEIVKECEAIYDPLDKNYFCRPYVENLWREVDIRLGKRPGACLSKWTNLRISFRREYQLLVKKKVKPSWIYFQNMLYLQPFLRRKRQTDTNIETHIQEALQQINSITRGNCKNFVASIETCDPDQPESVDTTDESVGWSRLGGGSGDDGSTVKEETSRHDAECFDNTTEVVCDESIDDIEDDFSNASDVQAIDENTVEIYETETTTDTPSSPRNRKRKFEIESTNSSCELNAKKNCSDETVAARDQQQSTSSQSLNSLCECKTNPDAMFLLSLMPDIQSLTRKDKGMLKIEIQRLIQKYLYPDDE